MTSGSRERYLSESELQRLGEVLDRAERERWVSAPGIAAIRLLILTGCRSSEILKLRWDEVDFERRCLQLPDSKTGRRTVVLNTAALRILADLEPVEGNPYVIPGGKKGGHLSSLQNLWHRVRAEADIKDVRIHDLRHTYASIGVNTGQSLSVVGKLLGHSKILTTQRYAHLADDPVRTANEQIGATIEATLSGGALSLGLCQQRSHPATRSPAAPVGFAGGVPAELSTSIWSLIEHIARVSVNVAVRAARQCPKLGGDNVMQLDRATSPVLLTEKEASRILGFSKRTLQKWRLQGRGPTFVRVSPRAIRYLRDDLESWIKERLRTSMSDTTEEQEVSEGTPIPELKTETHAARPTPTPADADSAG